MLEDSLLDRVEETKSEKLLVDWERRRGMRTRGNYRKDYARQRFDGLGRGRQETCEQTGTYSKPVIGHVKGEDDTERHMTESAEICSWTPTRTNTLAR